jgi:hypothetical protein
MALMTGANHRPRFHIQCRSDKIFSLSFLRGAFESEIDSLILAFPAELV